MVLRNPKNLKKYLVKFVAVKENLTPLIRAQAAQHIKLVTVNVNDFMTTTPTRPQQAEVEVLNAADENILSNFPRHSITW